MNHVISERATYEWCLAEAVRVVRYPPDGSGRLRKWAACHYWPAVRRLAQAEWQRVILQEARS